MRRIVHEQGEASQTWSQPITYRWDSTTRVVTRMHGTDPARVVARRVTSFGASLNNAGQVRLGIEAESGNDNRGTLAAYRQTVRVTPRNDLR